MSTKLILATTLAAVAGTAHAVQPTPVLSVNPGFLDLDNDGTPGDNWGSYGAALATIDFFGDGNPGHGSLFGDNIENAGGIFQTGIPATPGVEYEATFKIQWEVEWDAATYYGVEFYASDDATKLGEVINEITEDSDFSGTGYRRYDVVATAPAGAAFIRPIVSFDSVQSAGASRACTVDNILVRQSDVVLNLNPGFGDLVGNGVNGDQWGTWGATALDLDFNNNGNPGHVTFFADMEGNFGGLYQIGVPAEAGESYTFSVDIAFEENWQADMSIVLEFYGDDDGFILGEVSQPITAAPGAGYLTYQVEATAPNSFTRFVRPVIHFENAVGAASQASATVDNAVVQLTSTVSQGCNAADLAEPYGVLNFFDVSQYLGYYNSNDPAADLAAPFGQLNFFDVSAFLGAYNGGCP